MDLVDSALAALYVLLGFGLSAAWDRYRRRVDHRDERSRILKMIELEIQDNAYTSRDVGGFLEKGEVTSITTIPPLKDRGVDVAIANWSLLALSEEAAKWLSAMYLLTDGINGVVRARELFQLTMMSLSTYGQIMSAFQTTLREKYRQYVKDHEQFKAAWFKLEPYPG